MATSIARQSRLQRTRRMTGEEKVIFASFRHRVRVVRFYLYGSPAAIIAKQFFSG